MADSEYNNSVTGHAIFHMILGFVLIFFAVQKIFGSTEYGLIFPAITLIITGLVLLYARKWGIVAVLLDMLAVFLSILTVMGMLGIPL